MLIKENSIKRELVIIYIDSLKILQVIIYTLLSIAFIAGLFIKKRSLKRGVNINQEFIFDIKLKGSTLKIEVIQGIIIIQLLK